MRTRNNNNNGSNPPPSGSSASAAAAAAAVPDALKLHQGNNSKAIQVPVSSAASSSSSSGSSAALLHPLANPMLSPLLIQNQLERLDYDVHSWSSFSAHYHPRHVKENKPTDQGSRWSSGSNNQTQFIMLKLDKPSIIRTSHGP